MRKPDEDSPYYDGLFDGGDEEAKPKSRWELELEGFNANESGRPQRVPALTATGGISQFKELARVKVAPEAARDWTITLANLSAGNSIGPFQVINGGYTPPNINDAAAIVEWKGGHQGVAMWAIVDWTAGQQFSVYGSSVRVSGIVASLAVAAVGPNAEHVLQASISPGKSNNVPRRTIIYPTPLGIGASFAIAAPPFAKNVTFSTATAGTLGPADVELSGELALGATTIWVQFPQTIGPVNQSGLTTFRLPVGSNFLRITNSSPGAILQPRLLYELALS